MRTTLGSGVLAATLVSAAATATPITVNDSNSLVTDVEFWGRQQITSADPNNPGVDIISYGDPVQGTFRIARYEQDGVFLQPSRSLPEQPNAVLYAGAPGAEFVHSGRVPVFHASSSDDSVTIGDAVRFFSDEPLKDWFQVSDRQTDDFPTKSEYYELFVTVTTPLDIIQGTGLDQEFDLLKPEDNGGSGFGFFRTKVDGAVKFMEFIVDRLRVTNNGGVAVCTP